MPVFDYVVVGGGSAGCCLAARLSEDPNVSVLLIEAGPRRGGILVDMPAMIIKAVPPNRKNWNYWTEPQAALNGRALYWPRGKVMGGSSAINAMLYVRGHAADYDEWAALGCTGWDYSGVLPYFVKSQTSDRMSDPYHGTSGPLRTTTEDGSHPLTDAFMAAARAHGLPHTDDFNGHTQEGTGLYDRTIAGGRRQSSARAYLSGTEHRPNLTIWDKTLTTRITLKDGRAVGVEALRGNTPVTASAVREVLLCGGAINSPQLLQLSGIGHPDDLKAVGIEVKHALTGVGRNLQDHLDAQVTARLSQPISFRRFEAPHRGSLELIKWLMGKPSALGANLLPAGAFLKSTPEQERPDLQLHMILGYSAAPHGMKRANHHGFGIHVCQLRPESRGRIYLKSADPRMSAGIDPNYLSADADTAAMRAGVRLVLQLMRSPAFAPYIKAEHEPWQGLGADNDTHLDAAIRQTAETIYHPVGTCAMGPANAPSSVVDPDLKLIGIEGLRVVDASIMPRLIGGNTNAPAIMIAEKAADIIKNTYKYAAPYSVSSPVKAATGSNAM